jgi:hypothetical protein
MTGECRQASRNRGLSRFSGLAVARRLNGRLRVCPVACTPKLGGCGEAPAARLLAWTGRALRRKDRVAVLRYREARQEELRKHLEWPADDDVPEVVVIRLGHEDAYGRPDTRRFAVRQPQWMKYEVKTLHDRGVEVLAGIEFAVIKRGRAVRVRDESVPGAAKVFVVGRIPYEHIAHIDWRGDQYYTRPKLYVAYGWRGPCRETVVYEPPRKPHGYMDELIGVRWRSDRWRVKRLTRRMRAIRMMNEDLKTMRAGRDGKLEL